MLEITETLQNRIGRDLYKARSSVFNQFLTDILPNLFLKTFSKGYKTRAQSNILADILVKVKALGKRSYYNLFCH